MPALLAVVFVLSGAAGLIYESIWSRYLGLFVGHGAYAQILVLVIFLGGMSLGAWLVGERSARLARPLTGYALVEIAAGLVGLVFHAVFAVATRAAYDSLFPALAPFGDGAVTAGKWLLAGLLILPQSVLLGTTFPLMSAGVLRRVPERPGHVLGLLYFANSLGAAVGVLVAGFWMLGAFGLPGTLRAAALLNLLVGVVVLVAERVGVPDRAVNARGARGAPPNEHDGDAAADAPHPSSAPVIESAPAPTGSPLPPVATLWPLLLAVSFGTAVASFVYEIAWIRMLALVLGSATHAFELMLSAFILGLALGAWWIRRRADRLREPLAVLGLVQWAMGVLAVSTLPLYVASFHWASGLAGLLQQTDEGYVAYGIARYALCLAVMLPATFCAGMTLPLITRLLLVAGAGERAIGAVYSVNTLGSIIGVALAGLVLMPLLGLQRLLVFGAAIDIVLGFALLAGPAGARLAPRSRRLVRTAALATIGFVAVNLFVLRLDQSLLVSGVFRYGTLPPPGTERPRFYRDGRTATVSVREHGPGGLLTLATNGKPDASMDPVWVTRRGTHALTLSSDMGTQLLLPLLTLAHAPAARTAAVIGQGSGLTSHVLLASPRLARLETIEIEPEMIAASRLFLPANRRVFDDPRAVFVVDDAKSHFAARRRQYDLIISEPSNPWVSGVSGLFTREFYQRVRRHLAPGGVFGQWLHLYEIDDSLVLSVLAALEESFPAYDVYFTGRSDVLIVASMADRVPPPDWGVVALPGVREDLRGVVPLHAETLERLRFASAAALRPLLATVTAPNSDYHPVLDVGAERARFLRTTAEGLSELGSMRFDMAAALTGRRLDFGTIGSSAVPDVARAAGLARGSRLRAARDGRPIDAPFAVIDARYDSAAHSLSQLRALARGNVAPPASWRLWLDQVRAVERVLHLGTAGVADERFYAEVRDYARRAAAPPGVHDALAFHHGLAAWDWREASESAERLLLGRAAGSTWVPVDQLRDGAVVAALRLGDRAGALRIVAQLASDTRDLGTAFHLRTRLLQAHAAGLGGP
ncbi:MAG TPA: fused MFS/spermidine synthase [Gemmatimonadaceae bacterium]|nr:fused MFS/spermidine synthase [Gemmatimonadaceae bacterium]